MLTRLILRMKLRFAEKRCASLSRKLKGWKREQKYGSHGGLSPRTIEAEINRAQFRFNWAVRRAASLQSQLKARR